MLIASYSFKELVDIIGQVPLYAVILEVLLVLVVTWLVAFKRNGNQKPKLTKEEEDTIINRWNPEPLFTEVSPDHPALTVKLVKGCAGKKITIDEQECLNFATHNYFGFIEDIGIKEDAVNSVDKYGVGSCGPRGFYGTVDVHLELEDRLAKFMQCEEAVLYSYAFSTVASAIQAYVKRNDIAFVDESVNFAIQKGLDASRSQVVYFKHNDLDDLREILEKQQAIDQKNPKRAAKSRRFLIIEGVYVNTGEMCPLPGLIDIRRKYKLRMIMDESVSFGTIGATGRGVVEHFDIDRTEVDLISSSLEHAIGSIGGFCVGSHFIVDHQRLSGIGYCFSASLPPLLAKASISALDQLESQPELVKELQANANNMHKIFSELTCFSLGGHPLSPVKHLYLVSPPEVVAVEQKILNTIINMCLEKGIAIVQAQYLEQCDKFKFRPSIRLTANKLLTETDMRTAFTTIESVSQDVLSRRLSF